MVTAGIAIRTLGEKAGWMQWVGILLNLTGAYLYFHPVDFPRSQWLGILLAFTGMVANSVSTVLGRKVNRTGKVSSVVITTISMGIGVAALLATGLAHGKISVLTMNHLLLGFWLDQYCSCLYTLERSPSEAGSIRGQR
jgi:drug/metabolite transporter (DMT)-like permease